MENEGKSNKRKIVDLDSSTDSESEITFTYNITKRARTEPEKMKDLSQKDVVDQITAHFDKKNLIKLRWI